MIPVSLASQVRELDRRAIEEMGLPGPVLMENAGRLATRALLARHAGRARRQGVLVACGKGNNGGDGYVVARHLTLAGVDVAVAELEGDRSPDATLNRAICQRMGLPLGVPFEPERYGVVVDAMLGTGLSSPLRGRLAAWVDRIERTRAGRILVALDIPTGLNADRGSILGCAPRADLTVTFGRLKAGFFLEPGPDVAGELVLARIGLDVGRYAGVPDGPDHALRIPEPADVAHWLPARPANAHKGTFGHLAVVAGSAEKTGAAVLCANAALRAGAGLVTLFVERAAWGRLVGLGPEIMVEDVSNLSVKMFGAGSPFGAMAVGPGLGRHPEVVARVRTLWREAAVPGVFDADGVNALVGALEPSSHPRLLTPHPGEAARLLDDDAAGVQADRRGALERLSAIAPTLLKGRFTLQSDTVPWVNPTGGPQLATAGTGDVLTGVVGALLAQGLPVERAGITAAYLHGLAATRAGDPPIVAGEVSDHLPGAVRALASGGVEPEGLLPFTSVGP